MGIEVTVQEGEIFCEYLVGDVRRLKQIWARLLKKAYINACLLYTSFIAISNPVDIIAHYIYKLSGLPKNQVIGTGTAIDSARLQNMIAQTVNVDPRSVHAYSMGEHGDSQMVPWSTVTIAGKPFYDEMCIGDSLWTV